MPTNRELCEERLSLLQSSLVQQQRRLQEQVQLLLEQHHAAMLAIVKEKSSLSSPELPPSEPVDCARDINALAPSTINIEARTPSKASEENIVTETPTSNEVAAQPKLRGQGSKTNNKAMRRLAIEVPTASPQNFSKERVAHFMRSHVATGFVAICIMLNTIAMFAQLQALGYVADVSLGLVNPSLSTWAALNDFLASLEYAFAIVFLLEFLLNVYGFRWEFFCDHLNVLDGLIVLLTTVEVFVLQPLALDVGNIAVFRILRLGKIVRSLRVVRTMSMFSSLRILLKTVSYSMGALFWSMCLMFLLILMCATFLCQTLHDFVKNEAADLETRIWVNNMFGSGHRSFWTVFEMTFSGCWPSYASRVVKDVSHFYAIFFALYVTFVIFGMMRIISALFLSETMQQVARDADIMIEKRTKKMQNIAKDLSALFDEADTNGDSALDMEELDRLLLHPKVCVWLAELGVDASDTQLLFDLLDDGDGQLSKQEFVGGITRLKGEARAQDLVPVAAKCSKILEQCNRLCQTCDHLVTCIDRDHHLDALPNTVTV